MSKERAAQRRAGRRSRPVGDAEVVEAEGLVDAEVVDDARRGRRSGAVDADLDALLADAQRERDEYLELAQRARADFENYRRRVSGERRGAERRGKSRRSPVGLLPALDNLERALTAAGIDPRRGARSRRRAAERRRSPPATRSRPGVALVYRELRDGARARRRRRPTTRSASASTRPGTRRSRPARPTAPSPGSCSRRSSRATASTTR